jgi:SAM-dependent methyltransferase
MSGPDTCLICGSTGHKPVFTYAAPDDYERTVGVGDVDYERAWVRCVHCGFHYSHYGRDPEILDRIYESAYRNASAVWRGQDVRVTFAKVTALPASQSETKQRIDWIKGELAQHGIGQVNGHAHLLDIGGASGVFAYEFQDDRWRSAVVDPSESGRFIEDDHGIPYTQAAFRPGLFDRSFDLVSMVYVLEHLRAPEEALRNARHAVTARGGLYIEVPDARAFAQKPAEDDIFNACHLWMFDPMSLRTLLGRSGFRVVAQEERQTARGHYALMALAVPA